MPLDAFPTNEDISRRTKEFKFPEENPGEKPLTPAELLDVDENASFKEVNKAYVKKLVKLTNKKARAPKEHKDLNYDEDPDLVALRNARDFLQNKPQAVPVEAPVQPEQEVTRFRVDIEQPDTEPTEQAVETSTPEITRIQIPVEGAVENPAKQEARVKNIWKQMEANPQLRAILSYVMLPENTKDTFVDVRDELQEHHVNEFYERYPTMEKLNSKMDINKITDLLLQDSKKEQYKALIPEFLQLMYPQ